MNWTMICSMQMLTEGLEWSSGAWDGGFRINGWASVQTGMTKSTTGRGADKFWGVGFSFTISRFGIVTSPKLVTQRGGEVCIWCHHGRNNIV